ncbi:MAG: glycosyltransferase family 39 protein [Byssovorax sp.]
MRLFARFERGLARHLRLFMVTVAALSVRLNWNLRIHPPAEFAYSDMGGYIERATAMLTQPWVPRPWFALFPYGTHVFIALVKLIAGKDNKTALGVAFALLGAIAVAYTYATVERFTQRGFARLFAGLVLIFYYPWISLGGYALSETPFAACVAATAFYGLRLADRGRPRDAWLLGISLALGTIMRPQHLVSAAFLLGHWLWRKQAWKNMHRTLWIRVFVPLGVILAFSSVRLYWHTSNHWKGGIIGLVSTNGPLNYAFGRCHATGIEANAKDGKGFFGPPPFGSLLYFGKDKAHPPILPLDPAMGETVRFSGHMWDAPVIYDVARQCVQKTGYYRQFKYALTHVVLLWGYNIPWPDQGQKPQFRDPMLLWSGLHNIFILPPAALLLFLSFRKKRARMMLVSLHVWAEVLVAILYFGDTRYRVPYDGLLILLAAAGYAAIPSLWRALRRVIELSSTKKLAPQSVVPR